MKVTAMLEALEDAATRLEVRVSYEPLAATVGHGGKGGLCRVRGQYRVIIDKRATTEERVATLAQSLARVTASGTAAGGAALELPPAVRELVDFYAAPGTEAPAARPASSRPPIKRAS
ncbi:MAG TPA: hypothetical protein VHE35_19225 [Kofleriaceae bacterium]|nr:hypothetical protein [Kofleriaceae bacterium]